MTKLEQDPCRTCGYEEGSIYCKEHCPHEAKIEQPPSGDAISRKIISAFLSGLISDETERKKALQYINELPPVNPQPCEDAISRQAVIDLAKKGVLVSNGNYESVCKAINELPPVNPTKTGHWIVTEGGFECSECGCISRSQADSCQYCGCRMIEPQESEE